MQKKEAVKSLFLSIVAVVITAFGSSCVDDNSLTGQDEHYTVSVKANDNDGGTVTINGGVLPVTNVKGTMVTLVATPNKSSHFIDWTCNGKFISNKATLSLPILYDAEYVANFGSCKLSIEKSEGAEKVQVKFNTAEVVAKGTEVTLSQRGNPDSGYKFLFWLANDKFVSFEKGPKITVTEDTKFKAVFVKSEVVKEGAHQVVDMGLSVNWASYNVGATKLQEQGDYFAWGETVAKSEYTAENYLYHDNVETLPLSADAANVNWGANWRMPTMNELEELRSECDWIYTTMEGAKGYLIIGKNLASYIFLPLTGYKFSTIDESGNPKHDSFVDLAGCYWSSSLSCKSVVDAGYIYFYSDRILSGYHERFTGQPIRAVVAK